MPYPKRSSKVLGKAERRISSLASIASSLDLGNGLTLQTYSSSIEATRQKLAAYNTTLSNLALLYDEMLEAEQRLADLNERMLMGVLTKYGRNSIEYEMAGGKRKRQRRTVKSVSTSDTEQPATAPSLTANTSVNSNANISANPDGNTSTNTSSNGQSAR